MAQQFPTIDKPVFISQSQLDPVGIYCTAIVDGQHCPSPARYWFGSDQGVQHRCQACYLREVYARDITIQQYMEDGRIFRVGEHYEMPPNPAARHHPVWTLICITLPSSQYPNEQAALRFQSDVLRRDGRSYIDWTTGSRDIEGYNMQTTERTPSPVGAVTGRE